jgi:uncharacterized peroxidase-related enzyme
MAEPTSFLSQPSATPEVDALLARDVELQGFVMNLTHLWSWRPDVYASYVGLRSELMEGSSLTDRDFAVLVPAMASVLRDSYCSLAWGAKLARLSDGDTAAAVIAGSDEGLTPREAALADWARRVTRDPSATTAADVEWLRAAGLSDREIFEATTFVALRLAFSTVNSALGARPDRQLLESAPEPVRSAVDYGRPVAAQPSAV